MTETIKIYPVDNAAEYYRGDGLTHLAGNATAFAGNTSSGGLDYVWPLRFDLSGYAAKQITSLKFYAKRDDSESNNVGSSRTIGAGVANYSSALPSTVGSFPITDLNNARSMPDGDTFASWDIIDGWNVLKSGTRYVALTGNTSSYTGFFTNDSSVASANRPYIELVYEEGTVRYGVSGAWKECEVYYGSGGTWHRVQPYYGSGGAWKQTGV